MTSLVKTRASSGCSFSNTFKFSRLSFQTTASRSTKTVAFLSSPESPVNSPANAPGTMDSSIAGECSAKRYSALRTPDSMMYKASETSPCLNKTWPSSRVWRSRCLTRGLNCSGSNSESYENALAMVVAGSLPGGSGDPGHDDKPARGR